MCSCFHSFCVSVFEGLESGVGTPYLQLISKSILKDTVTRIA
jgi:hypothetical protein